MPTLGTLSASAKHLADTQQFNGALLLCRWAMRWAAPIRNPVSCGHTPGQPIGPWLATSRLTKPGTGRRIGVSCLPSPQVSCDAIGCSYRCNWNLQANYQNLGVAEDPRYNLSGNKESWAPQPSRFILIHEPATYPWNDVGDTVAVGQWHYSIHPGKMFNPRHA